MYKLRDSTRFNWLHTMLKGDARYWLHCQPDWNKWDYEKLTTKLKEYASIVAIESVSRLERLPYEGDMHKFNKKFKRLASSCSSICPALLQKKIYYRAIKPRRLMQAL